MKRCKVICSNGNKCLLEARINGFCIKHLSLKNKSKRKFPKGCSYCLERNKCRMIKRNDVLDCKKRKDNLRKRGFKI